MCELQCLDKRLKNLKDDLSSLIDSFIELNPGYDRNLGLSFSRETDLLLSRSLLVLGHAELESFFEDLALDLLISSLDIWETKGLINYNLGALLFNSPVKMQDNDLFSDMPSKSIKKYKEEILEKNHGIKKNNLNNIYAPIGYNLNSIKDQKINQLIGTLDFLGGRRGESAHHNQCSIHNPISFPDLINIFQKDILNELYFFIVFLKKPHNNNTLFKNHSDLATYPSHKPHAMWRKTHQQQFLFPGDPS